MSELLPLPPQLAWPSAIVLAWWIGELGHRFTGLPRISLYGLVGFALGSAQLGWLPPAGDAFGTAVANIAFGLILFEFGYRINLGWLRNNAWLTATGVLEAVATFAAVYALARWAGSPVLVALLLASLSMSTSPAALMRVINEQRCSGQATERVLHLAAINCVLAVFAFKVVVGFWTYESSGSLLRAASNSLVLLAASATLGATFGVAVPGLLRLVGRMGRDATIAFALAVILLAALAQALKLSPVVATLAFGLVARHRRVALNPAQRNFGALGDLLTVLLFVYVATTIEWTRVMIGLELGLALVVVRLLTKVAAVGALARVSGVTWRKGLLSGVALMPISVFVILLLEQTRALGVDLVDQLAPLAAATLLLELIGPVVTQRALAAAGEMPEKG